MRNRWLNFKKIIDRTKGIYRIYFSLIKWNRKISKCNRLHLETLGYQPITPNKSPRTLAQYKDTHTLVTTLARVCPYFGSLPLSISHEHHIRGLHSATLWVPKRYVHVGICRVLTNEIATTYLLQNLIVVRSNQIGNFGILD